MFRFPRAAETLTESSRIAFTRPTVKRCATLLVGAILAQGRRTIAEVQWTARDLMPGHFCVQAGSLSHNRGMQSVRRHYCNGFTLFFDADTNIRGNR